MLNSLFWPAGTATLFCSFSASSSLPFTSSHSASVFVSQNSPVIRPLPYRRICFSRLYGSIE